MINHLIKNNKDNQRSQDWHENRYNKLTASDIASALESNPFQPKIELLKKKSQPFDAISGFEKNDAVEWGIKYEPIAIRIYEKIVKEKVFHVGLVEHPKYDWLGASPDGLLKSGKMVEIKCLYNRKLTNDPPLYYWMQMQMQMETCNLSECDLFSCKFIEIDTKSEYLADTCKYKGFDNGVYWKLENYSLCTVKRDKSWFANNLSLLRAFWDKVLHYRRVGYNQLLKDIEYNSRTAISTDQSPDENIPSVRRTRSQCLLVNPNDNHIYETYETNTNHFCRDWTTWVSATDTRNYILKDPILDWLNLYGRDQKFISDGDTKAEYDFNLYLRQKGLDFEEAVIKNLRNRFGSNVVEIGSQYHGFSVEKAKATIDEIKKGTPIIYQGVLHNHLNNTYGVPDLIVRSDYLGKIVEQFDEIEPEIRYVIIEIKFSGLKLKKDGCIYNQGRIAAYKGQVAIYTEALNLIHETKTSNAYILGRNYTIQKEKIRNAFRTLGRVELYDNDKEITEKTKEAVQWMKDVKTNGRTWDIYNPCRKELLPNMCNKNDYPWHQFKKQLATDTNDITMLWNCGIKERDIALRNKKIEWTDDGISGNLFGFKGKRKRTLDKIIAMNKSEEDVRQQKRTNTTGFTGNGNVKNSVLSKGKIIEFFVDFEYVNDIDEDFGKVESYKPGFKDVDPGEVFEGMIYMIGVGYADPGNKWIFKSFTVDRLNYGEEKRIVDLWLGYMDNVIKKYKTKETFVYHWSNAEVAQYNRFCKRNGFRRDLRWYDLMGYFKRVPIVSKGVFGFSLKNVAREMFRKGFIATEWSNNEIDGITAMLMAFHCEKVCAATGKTISNCDEMQDIIKYNEVDCKVMWEIINHLR